MKKSKKAAILSKSKSIDLALGNSSIVGYETNIWLEDDLSNYLDEVLEQDIKESFLAYLQSISLDKLTVLKHIYVNSEERGLGHGTKLLNQFLNETNLPIILVCDNLESQENGFSLIDWYKSYNFTETGFMTLSGPILIKTR